MIWYQLSQCVMHSYFNSWIIVEYAAWKHENICKRTKPCLKFILEGLIWSTSMLLVMTCYSLVTDSQQPLHRISSTRPWKTSRAWREKNTFENSHQIISHISNFKNKTLIYLVFPSYFPSYTSPSEICRH